MILESGLLFSIEGRQQSLKLVYITLKAASYSEQVTGFNKTGPRLLDATLGGQVANISQIPIFTSNNYQIPILDYSSYSI